MPVMPVAPIVKSFLVTEYEGGSIAVLDITKSMQQSNIVVPQAQVYQGADKDAGLAALKTAMEKE